MSETIRATEEISRDGSDRDVGRSVQAIRKFVSDENWFPEMARSLFAKPGLELHLISRVDERSCHRYAAGTVKPPAYFLRQLFRSEQGARVLEFVMDGSSAEWWRDLKAARELCAKYRIEPR